MRYEEITAILDRANPDEWVVLPVLVTEGRIETVLGYREDLTVTLVLFDDHTVLNFEETLGAPVPRSATA